MAHILIAPCIPQPASGMMEHPWLQRQHGSLGLRRVAPGRHVATRVLSEPRATQAQGTAAPRLTITELHGGVSTTYSFDGATRQKVEAPQEMEAKPTVHPPQPWRGNQVVEFLRTLFMPEGYPNSVTDDYLPYQLWTVPTHVLGWLSHALTTSSLLRAVGITATPGGATAAAATIQWILKDGIGSAGRLLVGGRFGREFDDDPRHWRMVAEIITTIGLALEIATSAFPKSFLVLASSGNFAKAFGHGMGRPVFRVIQTHFAADGTNVGAVAAKEEVWEVAAQMAGYAASIALLEVLDRSTWDDSWEAVVGLWAVFQTGHVVLRYVALSQLRFKNLNLKRAAALVAAHVSGRPLPSVAEGNTREPMLQPLADVQPQAHFGLGLEEAWAPLGGVPEQEQLAHWAALFDEEEHLLTWHGGCAHVLLKEGAQQQALLRALYQVAWLDGRSAAEAAGDGPSEQIELLRGSVAALQQQYTAFLKSAAAQGWDTSNVVIKAGPSRVRIGID